MILYLNNIPHPTDSIAWSYTANAQHYATVVYTGGEVRDVLPNGFWFDGGSQVVRVSSDGVFRSGFES